MRHHVTAYGEVIILHQSVEAFCPILSQPIFERLEGLGHILARGIHKSPCFVSDRV